MEPLSRESNRGPKSVWAKIDRPSPIGKQRKGLRFQIGWIWSNRSDAGRDRDDCCNPLPHLWEVVLRCFGFRVSEGEVIASCMGRVEKERDRKKMGPDPFDPKRRRISVREDEGELSSERDFTDRQPLPGVNALFLHSDPIKGPVCKGFLSDFSIGIFPEREPGGAGKEGLLGDQLDFGEEEMLRRERDPKMCFTGQ